MLTEHFVVERSDRTTTIRWRGGVRPLGDDGQRLEFVDLNSDIAIRNELFVTLCREVNGLVPVDRHTLCGPATIAPRPDTTELTARRAVEPERLAGRTTSVARRKVDRHRSLVRRISLTKGRAPVAGHLGRSVRSPSIRRAPVRTPAPR